MFDQESRKIVGKVCKRFELEFLKEDKTEKEVITKEEMKHLKQQVKELLYEWARDVWDTMDYIIKTDGFMYLKSEEKDGKSK